MRIKLVPAQNQAFILYTLAILVSFFSSSAFPFSGTSQAGGVYKFTIPARPVGTDKSFKTAEAIKASVPEAGTKFNAIEQLRQSSYERCPRISALIFKISDRLIQANDLYEFALHGVPGLQLEVSCLNISPTGSGNGASANSFGITIPSSILLWTQSDDEIAFVIAHEMAHQVLGHNELSYERAGARDLENEADQLGAVISANAGYDPRAAYDAFCGTQKFKNSLPSFIPCLLLNSYGDNFHGTTSDRITRVDDALNAIGFTSISGRNISPETKEALKEAFEIQSRHKSGRK